jgi:hypothetical protein
MLEKLSILCALYLVVASIEQSFIGLDVLASGLAPG